MTMYKNIAIGALASLLLAFTPAAHAQSADDLRTMQTFLDIMDSYFGIIESSYDISSDVEKSAIFQMQKIQEVYEERGEKARSIDVLKGVLQRSDNQTIRNAVYMIISDTLKEHGRTDEALEILQQGLNENIAAASGR